MVLTLIILLGLSVGVIVNQLGTDLPARRPPRRPHCPYCGRVRPWYHWVTLPTYVVGRGCCVHCAAPIPIRYPLVELVLVFVFGFLYLRYGLTFRFAFFALYTAIFVLVAVTDLERRLILNIVTLPAMALALLGSFLVGHTNWWSALLGGLVAYLFFLVVAVLGNMLFGPGALGGGDVKLAAFVGLVTGFPLVIVALVLTILIGGVTSVALLVIRLRTMRSHIPYGPFLIIGGWVTMLWGMGIADWFLQR